MIASNETRLAIHDRHVKECSKRKLSLLHNIMKSFRQKNKQAASRVL
jgi:hypothetical protein